MTIHHINCATLCPHVPGSWINEQGHAICHCLLVETDDGLVLVDTGLGVLDLEDPRGRLGSIFLAMCNPRLDPAETALRQIEAKGFRREDVRHIVPTHLDLDHAGGLSDFPGAKVHVYRPELEAALQPRTFLEHRRYRAPQWSHGPDWVVHDVGGDSWMGLESVRALPGSDTEVLLVPLIGHTRGHTGVAVRQGDRWQLHCGDAYFHHRTVDPADGGTPFLLRHFERFVETDGVARRANHDRLRALNLAHGGEVDLFSAHDPTEYLRYR